MLERGAGSGSRTPGGCSSSQLIPLFLAANAGAPLAVHEGPAAQGPDGIEHRVCHGFTGCGEGQDGQVRTGNPEHPCTELQGICSWKRELLSFLSENCIFINPEVPSSPQGGTNFSPTKPLLSCLFQALLVDGSSGALQTVLFAKQVSQEASILLLLLSVLPIATINSLTGIFWEL